VFFAAGTYLLRESKGSGIYRSDCRGQAVGGGQGIKEAYLKGKSEAEKGV
jgi:hypothetical protein